MDYDSLHDNELVKLSQNGDMAAGDVLLRRFKAVVSKIARPYFIMGGDRDDLVQEGMIGLYRAIREYGLARPGAASDKAGSSPLPGFASFASVCIKNQMLDAIKNASRKKHSPLNSSVSISVDAPEVIDMSGYQQNPEEILLQREHMTQLQRLVQSELSPLELGILDHYLEGHSYAQIAADLGISTKSVDNALYRIRKKVQSASST